MATSTLSRRPRVAIVGAGVSGLRAADVCLRRGIDVTIFEGRDRIGGRVAQAKVNSHTVDLGANWVHSANPSNPVLRLAQEAGSVLWEDLGDFAGYDADATPLPQDLVNEGTANAFGIMASGQAYSRQHCATIPADRTIWDYYKTRAHGMYDNDAERQTKERLLLAAGDLFGGYTAGALDTQSFKFLWLQEGGDGGDMFNASSYEKVLDAIAKPALDAGVVRLGHRITKITSPDAAAVELTVQSASASTTAAFDAAIVTIPLGALQEHANTLFHPPLPPRLDAAIANLGYGLLDKVYLSFPRAFWQDTTKRRPPGLLDWFTPAYAPANPARWSLLAMNMAAMPPPAAHPTILFYAYGECARALEAVAAAAPEEERTRALADWFRPYVSLLPGYDAADPACEPADALGTMWAADELAGRGSYSNVPVGATAADADIEALRAGVPGRRVWLAGEHTASFDALGTVHGAYLSGERAAGEVAAALACEK